MLRSNYNFSLAITDHKGSVVHRELVDDFLPNYEDLLFQGVCHGAVVNDGKFPSAELEPVWQGLEEGALEGIKLSLPTITKTYGLSIFAHRVWELLMKMPRVEDTGSGSPGYSWRAEAQTNQNHSVRKGKLRVSSSTAHETGCGTTIL